MITNQHIINRKKTRSRTGKITGETGLILPPSGMIRFVTQVFYYRLKGASLKNAVRKSVREGLASSLILPFSMNNYFGNQ